MQWLRPRNELRLESHYESLNLVNPPSATMQLFSADRRTSRRHDTGLGATLPD
jgi:hypothetical protein